MDKKYRKTRDADISPKKEGGTTSIVTPRTKGTGYFHKATDSKLIDMAITHLLEDRSPLALVSEDVKRYGDSVLVESDAKTLTINKPFGFWGRSTGKVRVYFQDSKKAWNFFDTKILRNNTLTLCTSYPDLLYQLQHRKFQRISAPENSIAYFYKDKEFNNAGVVNLSQSGMLISSRATGKILAKDSIIREIYIALSSESSVKNKNKDKKLGLFIVSKGRVVRAFRDTETNRICHGIAFEENHILQEDLELSYGTVPI